MSLERRKEGEGMSEKEKMNVNTAPAADASTGTAEDVEAIMKKYDRNPIPVSGRAFPKQSSAICWRRLPC